jgi:hypothetical protein
LQPAARKVSSSTHAKEITMNKLLIAVAAAATLATSVSAFAADAIYEYPQPATSTVTRAEVRAELARAVALGQVSYGEASYVPAEQGAALTRSEVRLALAEARRNNLIPHGEAGYPADERVALSTQVRAAHWQASANESGRNLFAARNSTRQF